RRRLNRRLHRRHRSSASGRSRNAVAAEARTHGSWPACASRRGLPWRSGSIGGAMRTRETDSAQGVGGAAKSVSEHLSSILRLEIELATTELKRKVVALGVGIGLGLGAAV